MRKHSAFFDGPEAIWDFVPKWNDFAELEGEFWCALHGVNPSVSPFTKGRKFLFSLLCKEGLRENFRGMPLSAFWAVFFPINPLLGAMGLVLTRLSRSSNTLKEVPCG